MKLSLRSVWTTAADCQLTLMSQIPRRASANSLTGRKTCPRQCLRPEVEGAWLHPAKTNSSMAEHSSGLRGPHHRVPFSLSLFSCTYVSLRIPRHPSCFPVCVLARSAAPAIVMTPSHSTPTASSAAHQNPGCTLKSILNHHYCHLHCHLRSCLNSISQFPKCVLAHALSQLRLTKAL